MNSRRNTFRLIMLAILYIALNVTIIYLSITKQTIIYKVVNLAGVFSALQFLVSIGMTLIDYKKGGKLAILFLTLSVVSAVMNIVKNSTYDSVPGIVFYISSIIAISLIRKGMDGERKISYTDTLTGIHNRRSFLDNVNKFLKQKQHFQLLYIDLDHFKDINDTMGHDKGDEVLRQIVNLWKKHISKHEILARIGGDEFVCVIPNKDKKEAKKLANKFIDELKKWDTTQIDSVQITASIGIVGYDGEEINSNELIRKADVSMYYAKNIGRNTVCYYDKEYDKALFRAKELEGIIRKALDNDLFYMNYQPQFTTKDKKLRGFESLIRLKTENGEKISPSEFIPVAEKSDLIIDIGKFVLRNTLKSFSEILNRNKDLVLSVNLSSKHILSDGFVESIKKYLKEYNFPPECLEIEITEYCLTNATDETVERLKSLKELGIKFAMDDFGTGYSSFSYLISFPIDLIKIDKSLVDGMQTGEIVKAIVNMGHTLGCEIISEGVESKKQIEILKQIDCDFIQGFVWGKPISYNDAIKLIDKKKI